MSTDDLPTQPEDSMLYQALVNDKSPELFCDACGFYPIEPVHGHFVCPSCKLPTKCCEGAPINL